MKAIEKKLLKTVKNIAKKQAIDPQVPGCVILYHQPKRPQKVR